MEGYIAISREEYERVKKIAFEEGYQKGLAESKAEVKETVSKAKAKIKANDKEVEVRNTIKED